MFKTTLAAAALGLGFSALAIPAAQAADGTDVTFQGGCRNWSVTFAAGDTATRFDVYSRYMTSKVVSETLQPGDLDTYAASFRRDGHPKIAVVWADGKVIAQRYFYCGSWG